MYYVLGSFTSNQYGLSIKQISLYQFQLTIEFTISFFQRTDLVCIVQISGGASNFVFATLQKGEAYLGSYKSSHTSNHNKAATS